MFPRFFNNPFSFYLRFISLQVHPDSGQLIGASIETMLLELSRLFSRPVMERNFHVFYYALAPYINDDVQRELSCAHLSDLSAGQMTLLGADLGQVEEASDSKNMATLLSAFKFLKFSNEEISFVFRIVSSCLHLREVKFYEVDQTVKIRSGLESLETACELLGVSLDKMKASIMNKSLRVSAASTVPYSSDLLFCQASLTSLIAALYSSLFDLLLRIINSELAAAPSQPSLSLGILDMAGFEFDKNNGFSQLCINYGSEKIQQLFLRKAILEELELYQSEGLPEFKVDLVHNDPVVQFYEDKSFGFFSILDAQSHLASGTDDAVLQILFQNLSNASAPSHISHRVYDRSSKSDSAFIIKHHAATVSYNIKGLLAANKEAHLRDDLMDTLRTSSLSILLKMLPTSTSTASAGGPVKVTAKKVGSSVQFRDQLLHLLQRLSSSPCHFIRCFSPNIDGDPESFNGAHVLSQLRSSGIFEAISVRMRGFPFRKSHEQFVSMYQSLAISVSSITPKLMSRKIISNVFGKADGIHVGERTVSAQLIAVTVKLVQLLILAQVFYKHSHHKALEAALKAAVYSQARTIQRHYRSHIARRAVRRLLQVHVACSSILQRLRGLKLDELLRSELKATLQEFGNARVPVLLELEKLILRSEETDPLEKQMLELLQQARLYVSSLLLFNHSNQNLPSIQSDAVASSDVLTARMHELLRRADVLGIDSDVIDKGRRLNAQTVVKMQRRRELAQFAASTDLDELETQVGGDCFCVAFAGT
jgi:myosin-5